MLDFDAVIARNKALGMYAKGEASGDAVAREYLFRPFAFGDDIGTMSLAGEEARTVAGMSRLEELRSFAAAMGIDEAKLKDDGELGFEARLLTFTASDETVDRYGDKILVDGTLDGRKFKGQDGKSGKGWLLKEYAKNPVFMAFHEYSPTFSGSPFSGIPLGVALDTWTDEVRGRKRLRQAILMSDGSSNPMAPLILNAYKVERIMRGCSVGFWPAVVYSPTDEERLAWKMGRYGVIFAEQNLWENSGVSIPANPNAVQEAFDVQRGVALDAFADAVQEYAPELAYCVRSVTFRDVVTVPVELPAEEAVEKGKKPHCTECGSTNLKCRDCGHSHKGLDTDASAGGDSPGDPDSDASRAATLFKDAARELREAAQVLREAAPKAATTVDQADVYESLLKDSFDQVLSGTAKTDGKE